MRTWLPPAPAASSVQPRDAAVRSLVAYPNPGNGRFQFRVAGWDGRGALDLEVYDLRGRRVRELCGTDTGGVLRWDGRDGSERMVAAGVYFYRLEAGLASETRSMLLIK